MQCDLVSHSRCAAPLHDALNDIGETPSRRHVQYERRVISCLGPLSMLANAPDVTKGPWRDAC